MGHTVAPMRWVIYSKIEQFKKMIKGMREPERSVAESLLLYVYQNISSISFANPLPNEIENNIVFTMLVREKEKKNCKVDDFSLLIFSLMVLYKYNIMKNPNERNLNRLLQGKR